MIVLHEQIIVERSVNAVFSYACEFANCEQWDATAISSEKIDAGPTGVGTQYDVVCSLPVGKLKLRYEVIQWSPGEQVVLRGVCPLFTVTDTIKLSAENALTQLDYVAEFEFTPALRALEPALRAAMQRMGKTAVDGLRVALEDNFSPPKESQVDRVADALLLPGLAKFSHWGYARAKKQWQPLSADIQGKHMLLTGASSGIGLAAARELARLGASLTLVVRSEARGKKVIKELVADSGNPNIALQVADMSVMSQVQDLVARLLEENQPIDVLVNNAGALFNPRQVTNEGLEKSFALLLMGPYLLTEGLLPLLQQSNGARVINVVSGGMYTQKLQVSKLQTAQRNYSGSRAYARAKRGLMVQTEQWAQQWQQFGISCNAMHPGWADTPGVEQSLPTFHKISRRILRTPEQGADTIVWLAAASEAGKVSGKLFLDRQVHSAHMLQATREAPREKRRMQLYLNDIAANLTGGIEA
jgi:dehydrogenase/reductase SDR family protein 12